MHALVARRFEQQRKERPANEATGTG